MNSILHRIDDSEYVIYGKYEFGNTSVKECKERFMQLVREGKMEGDFDDDKWMTYEGTQKHGIRFSLNSGLYSRHIGSRFGIPKETMIKMMKCYAIACNDSTIYYSIAHIKISAIRRFLTSYLDCEYRAKEQEIRAIKEFLEYIGTPGQEVRTICGSILRQEEPYSDQRELAHIVNYLAIAEEIEHLYKAGIDDDTFVKWFPVFFWVKVTFVVPLRATETMLIPFNCLTRKDGEVYLTIRRTLLKGKDKPVDHCIEKDYSQEQYKIPDDELVGAIERYISLTSSRKRRFLFDLPTKPRIGMLTRVRVNELLKDFTRCFLVGNKKYDFIRFASGIREFSSVSVGDSRHLAMANLYLQKVPLDIIRQLAGHEDIESSAHYFSNVKEIVMGSSIMQVFKKRQFRIIEEEGNLERGEKEEVERTKPICLSEKRLMSESVDDCIIQKQNADCMGCKYYVPTKSSIDEFISEQTERIDKSNKHLIAALKNISRAKGKDIPVEEIMLQFETDVSRYELGCNLWAEERMKEWQRHKNIQANC